MKKSLWFFVLWVAGSAAAVSIAFAGVALVDDEFVNPASAQQTSARPSQDPFQNRPREAGPDPRVRDAGNQDSPRLENEPHNESDAGDSEPSNGRTDPTPSPGSAAAPVTSVPTASPSPSSDSTEQASPGTTAAAPTAPAQAAESPSATAQAAPPTSTPARPPAQVLTFHLVGGSTAISFSADAVTVLWATPNPGFDVEIEPEGDKVRVDFESDAHESRIDAWWADGPRHEIREDADN